jgi:hypothetical protein
VKFVVESQSVQSVLGYTMAFLRAEAALTFSLEVWILDIALFYKSGTIIFFSFLIVHVS